MRVGKRLFHKAEFHLAENSFYDLCFNIFKGIKINFLGVFWRNVERVDLMEHVHVVPINFVLSIYFAVTKYTHWLFSSETFFHFLLLKIVVPHDRGLRPKYVRGISVVCIGGAA